MKEMIWKLIGKTKVREFTKQFYTTLHGTANQ